MSSAYLFICLDACTRVHVCVCMCVLVCARLLGYVVRGRCSCGIFVLYVCVALYWVGVGEYPRTQERLQNGGLQTIGSSAKPWPRTQLSLSALVLKEFGSMRQVPLSSGCTRVYYFAYSTGTAILEVSICLELKTSFSTS